MGQRIDINHLNVYYGDVLAVQDVNMKILANKVTAFIGPSGCGKSTVQRTHQGERPGRRKAEQEAHLQIGRR